jgi:hypothetical protein
VIGQFDIQCNYGKAASQVSPSPGMCQLWYIRRQLCGTYALLQLVSTYLLTAVNRHVK